MPSRSRFICKTNVKRQVTGHSSLMSRFKLLRLRRSFIGNSISRPLIGHERFCDQLMPPLPRPSFYNIAVWRGRQLVALKLGYADEYYLFPLQKTA